MTLHLVSRAFLLGVVVAALGFIEALPLIVLGCAGVATGYLVAGQRRLSWLIPLLLGVFVFGAYHYDKALPPREPGGVALLNDTGADVTLRGVIADDPEERDTTRRFTLEVEAYSDANGAWQAAPGRVLVTAHLYPEFLYGDAVEVTGRLETPPVLEDFDYRDYLARRGVVATVYLPEVEALGERRGSALMRPLRDLRNRLGEGLERSLPEPESALARGILLGQRASISDELTDDFNRAGISHLVAISGQNVTLIAGFVVALLASVIGRRPATLVAFVVIAFFVLFVGASPPVLRGGAMATVLLGATLAGRPSSALPGVLLVGAAILLFSPLLVDDVSFQLSFAATLGIVLVAPRLHDWLLPRLAILPGVPVAFLSENLAITIAASLAVFPVIGSAFGRVSLIALVANLAAAPVFVLAWCGALVTALAGAMTPGLGRLAAEVCYLPLHALVVIAEVSADVPLASINVGRFGVAEVVATGAALAGLTVWIRSRRIPEPERAFARGPSPALYVAFACAIAAVFVWWSALTPGEDRLRVTVLDVGQGDAILIETPAGGRILVDGGPSGTRLAEALGRVLPNSERRIDLVVLTHPHDDHVTGLVELLQRFDVGAAISGPQAGATDAYDAWIQELARQDVPLRIATAGESLNLGDDTRIDVLAPPTDGLHGTDDDVNNNSVVLRVVHGSVSFLLTGDLSAEGEAALLYSGAEVHSTVLKVGHHGSDDASTTSFIDAVAPEVAVISLGDDNDFGHPSPSTRLRLAGIPLLRTDLNGDVRFETDGTGLWVAFQRGEYSRVELGIMR